MSLKKYSSYYYIFFPREPGRHTYTNYFKNVDRKCQLLIDFKTLTLPRSLSVLMKILISNKTADILLTTKWRHNCVIINAMPSITE